MLMRRAPKHRQLNLGHQGGVTLMELMIAAAISIIASAAMLALMANTLGSGTKTIKMTRLTQEMRSAMQIMTRELRRANYHGTYAACFGDENCITTLGIRVLSNRSLLMVAPVAAVSGSGMTARRAAVQRSQ